MHEHPRARHADVDVMRRSQGALLFSIAPGGGESLRALLDRRGAGGVLLLRHLIGAMRGAAALHAEGVVHGDIRPENIFLGASGREPEVAPKLLHQPGLRDLHEARAYRAPEQRAGWLIDARTDVYGFGVVLHEVLTGRLPADVHAPPRPGAPAASWLGPDTDHVPAGLARMVRAALQPDPALRPNSVQALMAAIEPYTRCTSIRGRLPPLPRTRASQPHKSGRARVGVAVATLALLSALGTALVSPALSVRVSEALAGDALMQVRSGLVSAAAVLPSFAARPSAPEDAAPVDLTQK